jgi:hypothetical protein
MKHELELRVQAWVDGELSDKEAGQMADWVARNADAELLAGELRTCRETIVDNEPVVSLPETREFHWSKIERQIQREAFAPQRSPVSWITRWRQIVIPATGVAALACVLALAVNQTRRPTFDEVSSTDQGMEAVTFHDQSAEMTVVWLLDNSQQAVAAQAAKPSPAGDANSDVELE